MVEDLRVVLDLLRIILDEFGKGVWGVSSVA